MVVVVLICIYVYVIKVVLVEVGGYNRSIWLIQGRPQRKTTKEINRLVYFLCFFSKLLELVECLIGSATQDLRIDL